MNRTVAERILSWLPKPGREVQIVRVGDGVPITGALTHYDPEIEELRALLLNAAGDTSKGDTK